MPNEVEMYRLTDSENDTDPEATWVVRKPDGSFIDTTGSTSQGLAEAINYASQNGYNLRVFGGGIAAKNGQDCSIIQVTTPIVIPPLQGVHWQIHATVNVCGPSPQPVAVSFDSIMNSTILWYGQIVVAGGWGIGVKFYPHLELPQDLAGPIITASRVWLPSVVMAGGTGICVDFDATQGGISGNIWEILEPNGGNTGVRVLAGNEHLFDGNHLIIREIHAQATGIQAGSLACGHLIMGNTWNVAILPTSVGAEIFGRNELWNISIDDREGAPVNGFTLNPGAAHNIIHVLRHDVTNVCNNASGNSTNLIHAP